MINTVKIPRAYSEVYNFINALGDEYKNKIPGKVYNAIRDNRDKEYNPIIEKDQTIKKGMLSYEALCLISALNLQYWCEDNEEKILLKEKYIENTKKEQEKYSYENLFKDKLKTNENIQDRQEHIEMIEYKEQKWYQRLFEKILKIFRKR